jgi:DNA-binding LacI/PurR family transcriptional regulator
MENRIDVKTNVNSLADRLEQDIRRRGLWAGDRYLTASEAAQLLQVSSATADRAMKLLAERQMLVRRRNSGTFVGPHFAIKRETATRTVYAITPAVDLNDSSYSFDSLIRGVRNRMANVNVQASFLPLHDPVTYARNLIQSALSAGDVAGFIPISCPHDVYRCLAQTGAPTVIFGTPYLDQRDIPSLDVDNRAAGKLLAEYLIRRGHRRVALLTTAEGRPGDNCFFDGVSDAWTEGGLPHNSLIARIVPSRISSMAAQLEQFARLPDPPTALIARSPATARAASQAQQSPVNGCAAPYEIAYQNHPATAEDELPFACVEPILSFTDIAARIGEMLDRLGRGERLHEPHVVIPVELQATRKEALPGKAAGSSAIDAISQLDAATAKRSVC